MEKNKEDHQMLLLKPIVCFAFLHHIFSSVVKNSITIGIIPTRLSWTSQYHNETK